MVEIMSTGSPKWHQFLNQLDEALVIDDDEESDRIQKEMLK